MPDQYRLIKKYPNSPELGTTVVFGDNKCAETLYGSGWSVSEDLCKQYTDFWIKAPKWDVLSFKDCGDNFTTLRNNGRYLNSKDISDEGVFSLMDNLINPFWKIHEVRRNEDHASFKVGDWIESNLNQQVDQIKEIKHSSKYDSLQLFINHDTFYDINGPFKLKGQPSIMTPYDQPIFKGDKYFVVYTPETSEYHTPYEVTGPYTDDTNDEWVEGVAVFKNRATAQLWIYENRPKKPLFTTEDGVEISEASTIYVLEKATWFITSIRDLRIAPSNHDWYLYFSTKEAAENYVLQNKHTLSLNDILSKGFFLEPFLSTITNLAKSRV